MKKMIAVLALVLAVFGSISAHADLTNTNAPNWSYNAGTILMSKYYGTIFGGTFYDGPMSFTDVNAVRQNRFGNLTFSLMLGQKLDRLRNYNKDGGNEYDAGFDQSFTLGTKAYPILVDVGVLYLAVYDLNKSHDDAFDETIRLDFPIRADLPGGPLFQPYVQAYHFHMVGDGLQEVGWIGFAGLIRNQSLGCSLFGNELKLNIDYRMGVNGGVYESRSGIEYHRLSIGLPIQYGKWSFTPSVIGQLKGGSDQTYVHENELFYTLSVRYSF